MEQRIFEMTAARHGLSGACPRPEGAVFARHAKVARLPILGRCPRMGYRPSLQAEWPVGLQCAKTISRLLPAERPVARAAWMVMRRTRLSPRHNAGVFLVPLSLSTRACQPSVLCQRTTLGTSALRFLLAILWSPPTCTQWLRRLQCSPFQAQAL